MAARCSELTRAGGFAKQLFQAKGSRASSKTRGRRQRLTGPTTVAGFYGGRPRYVIHGGAGTLTGPASLGALPRAQFGRDGPGWILLRQGSRTHFAASSGQRAIANEAVAVDWPVPTGHLAETLTASPTLPQLTS